MRKRLIKIANVFFKICYQLDPLIPYKFTQSLNYLLVMKEPLSLKHPDNFNEKIQWLKANYKNDLLVTCSDKYQVREYLSSKGLSNYLNELYLVVDNVDRIDFSMLPSKFALKTTNGCSTNLIVREKSKLNIEATKKKVKKWMSQPAGASSGEMHYQRIEPKIIIEKFLDDGSGSLPLDYKIFCFNGEPKYIRITDEKELESGSSKQAYFDFSWDYMHFTKEKYAADPVKFPKPKNLSEMYELAKALSDGFPFVRVDLYNINGKIIFGELTFTPTGGFGKMFTEETNIYFGELLVLPSKKTY